jgi:hypothetical protein
MRRNLGELFIFKGNAAALVFAVLLLFPSSASVLCIAPGNHISIEDINAPCCASSSISAQSGRQTNSGFNGLVNCQNCTDFFLTPNGREVIPPSNNLAASRQIADACLENLLSKDVPVSLFRSGSIGIVDAPIPICSSVPLRC